MNIDEFFAKDREKLYYIELQDSSLMDGLSVEVPLPIIQDDFAENIETGAFEEEVSIEFIIRGILFNMAVDPDFLYKKEYKEILDGLFANPEEELFYFAFPYIDEEIVLYFFRGMVKLGYKNLNMKFFYAWFLFNTMEEDLYLPLLKFYNEMIKEDEDYPLSYYGLGLLETAQLNVRKAELYYKKAKEKMDYSGLEDFLKEEFLVLIDEDIETIQEDVELQKGAQLLDQGRVGEALGIFEKLDEKEDSGIVKYFLGKTYLLTDEHAKADEYFQWAKDLGYKELSLYLDQSYLLSLYEGAEEDALELLEEGLEIYKDNEALLFNRALLYHELGEIEKAKEDLKTIISYDDISEEMYSNAVSYLFELENLEK